MLTLLLPETLDRDLPDTVLDAIHMSEQPSNRERTNSVGGDDTTTMSGIEMMGGKGGGSDHGNNTLVRMQGGTLTRIHSPKIEETNYGKSPEWVEIDGLIVSKNHVTASNLNASGNGMLSRRPSEANVERQPHFNNNRSLQISTKNGSVLSLPYSSQTLLSSNYSSTLEGSSSTTTTNEGSHGGVKRKTSNDSSEINVRRGNHLHTMEQNKRSTNIHLQSQLPGSSRTLPAKHQNNKARAKLKQPKPPSFAYQTTSSQSTGSGSSSCCSRSNSDCCSCHNDCPRAENIRGYPAPPPPRKFKTKQTPPPPPSNPPPSLNHQQHRPHHHLIPDRNSAFQLLQDIGGESQSERESENQYETIPASSLPAETDCEETETDNQTMESDSFGESGTDTRSENNNVKNITQRNHAMKTKTINDALHTHSYHLHHHPYHRSNQIPQEQEDPRTLESSLEPEEAQDTSVISAQHSGVYHISASRINKPPERQNDVIFDYRNNNNSSTRNLNNDIEQNLSQTAKLQGYMFRKRLLMAEANETIL